MARNREYELYLAGLLDTRVVMEFLMRYLGIGRHNQKELGVLIHRAAQELAATRLKTKMKVIRKQ